MAEKNPGGGSALESVFAEMGIAFDPSLITAAGTGAAAVAPPSIQELLLGTAMDVTGRSGETGIPFLGNLPLWAQAAAQRGAFTNPDLDPYLGVVSQPGDERVYLGATAFKPPKFDEIDDFVDVNAEDLGERAQAREDNLRIDRENKVERQLGGDPSKQDAGKKRKDDTTATATQVKNQVYLWEQDEVLSAMKRMRAAGLNITSFDDMAQVWGSMVDRAAATYSLSEGQKKITPWDVLDLYKSEAKAAGSYTNFQNGTQVLKNKSVSELSEAQAWTVLQSNLSQMLGRDPSDEELRDFTARMNSLAARNPSISRTIQQYKNGEVVSQKTVTDEVGFTADDVAKGAYEVAQGDDEYAETQAATLYFNAAQSALGALGQG